MATVQLTAARGEARTIDQDVFATLAAGLDGRVLQLGDDGFVDATRIWNAMAAKKPGLVVQPSSTQDVIETVGFVADNGLELSVKGGGHNIAGLALSDGGVTMDMGRMATVRVDPEARLVFVGPGCTLGDIDAATQRHGLATTLGFVSETGAAGLTLGGGFGYLTRRFGWTVDDLDEVEIVTADGRALRCSRSRYDELFWALRGGGGNFGVVTEFVYRLHPVGPHVTAGMIAWPAAEAPAVLKLFQQATAQAPRELTLAVMMRKAPPAPWLPPEAHGTPIVAVLACHTGTPEDAAADLAPIKAHGKPWADVIEVKPYLDQQRMLDATQPAGNNYYWKSEFLPGLTDDLLAAYQAQFAAEVHSGSQITLFHVAGALNEHPEDDGAVGNRDAHFQCVIATTWPPTDDSDGRHDWVRQAWTNLQPYSTGGNYVNFQTADEAPERTNDSYRTNLARLQHVKTAYDPHNVFHINRNISPTSVS